MRIPWNALADLAWVQLWQVTVTALLVGLVVRLACRSRPHLAYALWLLVLLKASTPPLWKCPTGIFAWTASAVETLPQSSPWRAHPAGRYEDDKVSAGGRRTAAAPGALPKDLPQPPELLSPEPGGGETRLQVSGRDLGSGRPRARMPAAVLAGFVWICGALGCLATFLGRRIFIWHALRRTAAVSNVPLDSILADLSRRLGMRRRIRVLVTSEGLGPAVFGIRRPTLLLPEALVLEKSVADLEPILAHELIHIRRSDTILGGLQAVIQSLWWFHPLIWWVNRQACQERERCCDEEVITRLNCPPETYAQCLLDVLKLKQRLIPLMDLNGVRPVQVTTRRLENIMKRPEKLNRQMPKTCWIAVCAAAALILPAGGIRGDAIRLQTSPLPALGDLPALTGIQRIAVLPTISGDDAQNREIPARSNADLRNGDVARDRGALPEVRPARETSDKAPAAGKGRILDSGKEPRPTIRLTEEEAHGLHIDKVKRGPFVREARCVGTLVAEQSALIHPATDGHIKEIHVLPGAEVKADTVIAELSNPELEQGLKDLELQRQAAEASLARLQSQLEGEQLQQQAIIATLKSDLTRAHGSAEESEKASQNGVVPPSEARYARAKSDELSSRYEIELQRLKLHRDSADSQIAQQRIELMRLQGLLQLKGQLVRALQVRAGIDGVVQPMSILERPQTGQAVTSQTVLARIVRPGRLRAELNVSDLQASEVQLDQKARIDTHRSVIAGRVIGMDPTVTVEMGTVTVYLALEEPLPKGIRPGSRVDGVIEIEKRADVLQVPRPVSVTEDKEAAVFKLVEEDQAAARVTVKFGRSAGNNIEVLEGLEAGDKIILSDTSSYQGVDRIQLN